MRRKVVSKVLTYVLMIIGALIFILPFFWMISSSLKPLHQIFKLPIQWIPKPITWSNYIIPWTEIPLGIYFRNSATIAAFAIIGTLFSCSLAGYSFARIRFVGRKVWFIAVLATLMVPYQVTIIPLFLLFRNFGLLDTHLALILPHFFGAPFFVFMMRQFFLTLPEELADSARIDGANSLQIFTWIYMPLAKPVIVAVLSFSFLRSWNQFFTPLIFLSSMEKYTLPVGITMLSGEFMDNWHWIMAVSVVTIMPCLFIFFACQKLFVQGIAFTGIKS